MATAIQMPFTLDSTGHVASLTDNDTITQQNVESLIGTQPGERLMLPTFGVNTVPVIFLPEAMGVVNAQLVTGVRQAMTTWLPQVTIQDIKVLPQAEGDFGASSIQVDYIPTAVTIYQVIQRATVLIGGTVVNDSAV
jgi:hypothetical protein